MLYKKIKRKITNGFDRLFDNVNKLITTIYYKTGNKDVIFINSWICQWGNYIIPRNFGDDINYYIIKHLSKKKVININSVFPTNENNYMCIGSVIEWLTRKDSIIWGTGAITGGNRKIKEIPYKVCAVRGPLTRQFLLSQNISCPEVYGDPALLLPLLYHRTKQKKYKIGLIPHYVDLKCPKVKEFYKNNRDVCLINFTNYRKWTDVIDKILECEIIVSSSLHGLIISDAYGIPNVWCKFSDSITGGTFKYEDYYGGVGKPIPTLLDYTRKNIDFNEILTISKEYVPIKYNHALLLSSCPFLINIRQIH